MKSGAIVEENSVCTEDTDFTVLKTSLFFAGDGFSAYDSKGNLIFRVDNYHGGDTAEVVLLDRAGRCILTVRRKRPSLHQRWEGFAGERTGQKALFSVRRSSMIGRATGMRVEVYRNPAGEEYQIEGSFGCRRCRVVNGEKGVVAEIKRKVDTDANVVMGKDVFVLSVRRGFDSAFAMGLILIMDQIHWGEFEREEEDEDDDEDERGWVVDPTKGSLFLPARINPRTLTRSHSL